MSTYIEIPVEDIELDKSNPRIARGIAYYGENITSETMALLLGSTSEACASLRESIRENGGIIHPIVVNKRTGNSYVVIEGNTRLQIYFCKKYANLGSVKIHGSMNMADRNRSVERFYTNDYRVLFATPASAKEGLTLTVANHVIFYDRGFSLDDYLQAQDRIHRISQKKTCYIHNIIMNESIDEWVDALLKSKQNAAFLAQGDISLSKYKEVADYSFGDLINAILFPEQEELDYE